MENIFPFHWTFGTLWIGVAIFSAGHALLFKRDPRSALGWIAICLMFPLAGPALYFFFGINRIHSRAQKLQLESPFRIDRGIEDENQILAFQIPPPLDEIARMSDAVVRRSLVGGNRVEPFFNGEGAYPPMLEAIDGAEQYLYLSTYIFETNRTGRQFIDALVRAKERGVDVRVIVDGVGEIYSLPRVGSILAEKDIRFVRFLPPRLFPPALRINLRNHRKLLVADGRIGFIGGMNLGDRHLADNISNPNRVADMHFRLTGPIVTQLEQVFLEDWRFSTREMLKPGRIPSFNAGDTICRAVVDGPNADIDRLYMILLCAFSAARRSVSIMMPYFLPSSELIAALQAAALRGVAVNIILPEKNNVPAIHWATRNMLPELLQRNVRVYYQPPPFVHTKFVLIDDHYAMIGSANLDFRSLRLNFELMVEVYGRSMCDHLSEHFRTQILQSREIFVEDLERRSLPVRLRDALCWLFTPYL